MTVGKGEFFYVPFRPRSNNRMDRLAPVPMRNLFI